MQTRQFADLEFLTRTAYSDGKALVEDLGDKFRVNFARRSEPDFKPEVHAAPSREAEMSWLRILAKRFVEDEEVRADDILVLGETWGICDEATTSIGDASPQIRGVFEPHRLPPSEKASRPITEAGKVTVTTTKTAKGHEAHVTIVVGSDSFPTTSEGRASFYVACTRSKLKLYVSGIAGSSTLLDESLKVVDIA